MDRNNQNTNGVEEILELNKKYRLRRGVDKVFLAVIILLLSIGIVMVATSSYVYAGSRKEFGYDNLYFFKRQLLFVVSGFLVMMLVTRIPYETIRKFTPLIFFVALGLLCVVLTMPEYNGAKRWISLGPISIQPSEIMKLAVILICADYIDRFHAQISLKGQPKSFVKVVLPFMLFVFFGAIILVLGVAGAKLVAKLAGSSEPLLEDGSENGYYGLICTLESNATLFIVLGALLFAIGIVFAVKKRIVSEAPDFSFGILPFGILIVVVGLLLGLEPHMSGLIITTLIIVVMMIIGGSSLRYLAGAVCAGSMFMLGLLVCVPHARARLAVWKNPTEFLHGGGWQPTQSLYAIGNGGILGAGIGQSRQKQLYIPEPMNDYIFAIWCEEFGFIGALMVILLFVYFVYRGVMIALRAPDRFSSMVVIGIVSQIGIQALLNMMVVTNTIPSTGIALPFCSYGGSSLMVLLAELGIVLSISRYSVIEKK